MACVLSETASRFLSTRGLDLFPHWTVGSLPGSLSGYTATVHHWLSSQAPVCTLVVTQNMGEWTQSWFLLTNVRAEAACAPPHSHPTLQPAFSFQFVQRFPQTNQTSTVDVANPETIAPLCKCLFPRITESQIELLNQGLQDMSTRLLNCIKFHALRIVQFKAANFKVHNGKSHFNLVISELQWQ